jgi:hypothetical protein
MRPGDFVAAGALALLPFAAIEAGKALSSSRLAAEPDTPAADSPMESEVVHER